MHFTGRSVWERAASSSDASCGAGPHAECRRAAAHAVASGGEQPTRAGGVLVGRNQHAGCSARPADCCRDASLHSRPHIRPCRQWLKLTRFFAIIFRAIDNCYYCIVSVYTGTFHTKCCYIYSMIWCSLIDVYFCRALTSTLQFVSKFRCYDNYSSIETTLL